MGKRDDLEALSSHELHDLAVHVAIRHMDVGFLWELLRAIPAAEAAEGHEDLAAADVFKLSALISDALSSGEGDIADALRPLYIRYLEEHHEKPGGQRPRADGRKDVGDSSREGGPARP